MGDIDLLIKPEDLNAVAEVLADLGYERLDRREEFAANYYYTGKFIKKRHGWVIVEPHWSISYPPFHDRIDMDAVTDRCRRDFIGGRETWLLAPEDVLLNLSFHLIHEGREVPFLRYIEIDRLLRKYRPELDWSIFVSTANNSGLGFTVHRVLREVVGILGSPVPEEVFNRLPASAPRTLEGRIASYLADRTDIDGRESLALMLATRGVGTRIRYGLALLFPHPAFMREWYQLTRRYQYPGAYIKRAAYFLKEGIRGLAAIFGPGKRDPNAAGRDR
jgi:hypothetical protein